MSGDYPNIIQILLDNGIKIYAQIDSAIDIASQNNYYNSAALLIKSKKEGVMAYISDDVDYMSPNDYSDDGSRDDTKNI